MSRNGIAVVPPPAPLAEQKPIIDYKRAQELVRELAQAKLAEAKRAHRQQEKKISAEVGGNITAFDETVVKQARNLMQRLALIAKHLDKSSGVYSQAGESKPGAKLRKIVEQLGGIVGTLEVILLADPSIGLFAAVEEKDFIAPYYGYSPDDERTISIIPESNDALRAEAEALLAQYEIVKARDDQGVTPQLRDEAAGLHGAKKAKAATKKIAEIEQRQKNALNITAIQERDAQKLRDAEDLIAADLAADRDAEVTYVDEDGESHVTDAF